MGLTAKEAKQLNDSKAAVKTSWEAACKFNNIDPTSKFVTFSNDNLAALNHNSLMGAHLALVKRIRRNIAQRERKAMYKDLGLTRVKGNLGGTYYE